MNSKKQKLLLDYLISSPDLFALCATILKPKYFDPEYRKAVKFMMEYFNENNAIPDVNQVEVETDVKLTWQAIKTDQYDYCCKELEAFCKQSAMEQAIIDAPALIDAGDYGRLEHLIKDAVTISLNTDLGVDFFADARTSLRRLLTVGANISTGWKDVDDVLFGGIQRKQLILFSAGSGGGKSITMQNLGLNLVAQGLNVLYISFELSEDLLSERNAILLSGVGKLEMAEKFEEMMFAIGQFASDNNPGKMIFKCMPAGSNCNHIKGYLKEYELKWGHKPDAIIADYMDLMSPIDKVSADNVFEKDKRVAEEFRNIGVEYNLIAITASQLNRTSVGAEVINHSHIAGGISKINTADVYITIIANDTLRAAGEIIFSYQKTRNSDGVGKQTYLGWNVKSLRITTKKDNKSSIIAPIANVVQKKPKNKLTAGFLDEEF